MLSVQQMCPRCVPAVHEPTRPRPHARRVSVHVCRVTGKPCAQGFFNNQRLVAPSAAFHWQARWGGAEVFVTGDWCAWAVRAPPRVLEPLPVPCSECCGGVEAAGSAASALGVSGAPCA